MKNLMNLVFVISIICSAFFAVAQEKSPSMSSVQVSKSSVNAMIESWPQKPREMAMKLMTKYGVPNEVTDSMLVWHKSGPWKMTILYKQEIPHEFPAPHTDFLQQVIDYRVPPEKFADLARYDGSVIVERTKGELSARCDMEELNMLALNLANDVVNGKRSVEDARDYYAKTATAFKQGKAQPYTERLQFQIRRGGTEDPDKPAAPSMASSSSQ